MGGALLEGPQSIWLPQGSQQLSPHAPSATVMQLSTKRGTKATGVTVGLKCRSEPRNGDGVGSKSGHNSVARLPIGILSTCTITLRPFPRPQFHQWAGGVVSNRQLCRIWGVVYHVNGQFVAIVKSKCSHPSQSETERGFLLCDKGASERALC